MNRNITAPLSDEIAKKLKSGDYVYITGTIYTARDAAHKRMWEALEKGEELPIEMKNNIIYYMGPSPARAGRPTGSAGPTTASRMDKYRRNKKVICRRLSCNSCNRQTGKQPIRNSNKRICKTVK